MKKIFIIFTFFLIISFPPAFALFTQVQGIEAVHIKRVAVSQFNPRLIYVASHNALYKSHDKGAAFRKVSVFKGEEVQHIFFDPYRANILYVATTRHLYKMEERLQKLFSVSEEEEIRSAARHREYLYVGTTQGGYVCSVGVLKWRSLKKLNGITVYYIEPAEKEMFCATSRGVYRLKNAAVDKKVFTVRESEEEEEVRLVLNILHMDKHDKKTIWLGTSQGLFLSQDKGKKWKKFYATGIDSLSILSIAQTSLEADNLYVGTPKGFFRINIKAKAADNIFAGLPSPHINWITFAPRRKLYVATAKGVFVYDYFTATPQSSELEELVAYEPSIREIQQQAMYYNEVSPEKIARWRNALRLRALFPSVSLDYDKTVYGSSKGDFAVGPRDWGVSFSWDVADLIWDVNQDNIDTRSRLNTQLRLDILDEVNRVYFERVRLKQEIQASSLSQKQMFGKKLRLDELTAILDGYTGGYFSRRCQELKFNGN